MEHRQLSLTIYRAIWRWARSANGVPFNLRFEDIRTVAPACFEPIGDALCAPSVPLHEADAVREVAHRAFRDSRHLEGEALEGALDRGLEALRLLHYDYASALAQLRKTASEHAERSGIAFPIGTCFLHRARGYRAVVFGWDRRCRGSGSWVARNQANPEQPYYYCLPDEDDCQRVFGSRKNMQYVGQDEIIESPGTRVANRALANFFTGFSRMAGRYVPNRKTAFEFPDEYPEPEVSIAVDANILERPEPPAPPALERFERE